MAFDLLLTNGSRVAVRIQHGKRACSNQPRREAMKRYLIGLALTGLGTRLTKRASRIVPHRRHTASLSVQAAGLLIAAGFGAGLARLFNKKS
jgi:hypothetical protein